ncbi:uncharacterized protein [Dysidea avara]|uniref:uncharacterized protein isoform X2 n=1 Tax=Dysidea avara TaxID=196820 RepID=UPI00332F6E37
MKNVSSGDSSVLYRLCLPFLTLVITTGVVAQVSTDVPDQVPNFLASRTVLSSSVQSITLTWDMPFDNFLPIVSYEIENCKREPTEIPPQCTANGSIILSPNVTEYTTNVSTDASYQFEITAQNSIGSSNGSIVKVLQPREPLESPSTSTIATIHNPPASLNVSWHAPEINATFEAPITGYEVHFFIVDSEISVTTTTGPETSLLQTGLIPDTEYGMTIAALNLIGRSPSSTVVSFQSGNSNSGPPFSLSIPDLGNEPNNFTVAWSPPLQPNGMIIDYEVQYKILTDEMFMSVTTPDTMIVLTSLVTDVEYTIRVRARNLAGFGNFTEELTVLNVLSVQFSELSPRSKSIIDGENAIFSCDLFGGSSNNSINVEWLITYQNATMASISGNNSNFILLPPSNNILVIVRASTVEFDRAIITCGGGHNFTGISANLSVNPLLSCDIENGRCEENCFINVLVKRLVGEGEFLSCFCPPNETLTDNRVCLSQFQYFMLYDEIYENTTTFVHHPLYHPNPFQISCHNDEGTIESTGNWRIVTPDTTEVILFDTEGTITVNFTIDGVNVPVAVLGTLQPLPVGNGSVATLTMSQAVSGIFSCEASDFDISLRVVTGGGPLLEVAMPVRVYGGMSPFNITVDAFYVNIFGRTVRATASTNPYLLEYRSESLTQPVGYTVVENNILNARAPQDFFDTYNVTQNTSYFELLFQPPNGPDATISFSLEYFDVHEVIELSGRSIFAVGEDLLLKCNTTPPDLPVTWERYTNITMGFVNLVNNTRSSFNPPDSKTIANLSSLNTGDAGDYECFSTIPQLADVRRRANDITIIPDTLTMATHLRNDQLFFLNGRRFYTETTGSTAVFFCSGLLQDTDVVFAHSRVDLSSNTSLANYNISFFRDDNFIQLVFNNFTVDLNGNLSCQSRMSGRERSIYIGATTSGVLAVPLITTPLEVLLGETAVFSYLIVLTNFSLNVSDTISVVSNPFNSMLPNLTLVEQGEEVYEFTIPSVSESMNGLQFTLETLEGTVVSPPITLQLLEVIVTTNQQVPIFALPNSTVRFDCSVIVPQISSPPNITLNWWYSVDGFVDVTTRNRSVQFEPQNLRHSLILENVTFEDSGSYACSFADNILDSNTFLLIVVEEPITIFSSSGIPLPNGVIINDIGAVQSEIPVTPDIGDEGPIIEDEGMNVGDEGSTEGIFTRISLVCATVPGYEDPFWTVTNNGIIQNPISNQTINISNASDIASLFVSPPQSRYLTLFEIVSNSLFPDELNGTYTCQTPNNSFTASVVLTNANPYLLAISPPTVEVDFFGTVTLTFQAAFNSDGINNPTQNVEVEQRDRNGVSVRNHSTVQDKRNSQIFSVTFQQVGGNLAGTYSAFIPSFPNDQVTVSLTVILPTLTATNQTVTVLANQSVTLECIPSDPSLEVEWFLVRDGSFIPLLGGEFINQQKKRNVIIFNNVVSEFPYYQITLKQVEVTDSGQYQCSIQPPSRDNTLIAQLIEVVVLPEPISIFTNAVNSVPDGAIVNDIFGLQYSDTSGSGAPLTTSPIRLNCFSVPGYEDPVWMTTNINGIQNPISNQTIQSSNGNELAILYVISESQYTTILEINTLFSLFPEELNGIYTCQSLDNSFNTSLMLTNNNPYLTAISPSTVVVDFFDTVMLTFQAALDSDGIGNEISVFIVEQKDTNGVSVQNHTADKDRSNSQIFFVTFPSAGGSLTGTYSAYIPQFPDNQVTVSLNVKLPSLIATNDNVTVLSGLSVTLECLPSNPSLVVNWFFEIDGSLFPLLDGELHEELKRNIIFPRRVISTFPYYQITLDQVEVADNGVYQCSIVPPIGDNTIIAQRITVTVLPACHGPTLSHGLLWPATAVNDTAMLQCSDANNQLFTLGPYVTRKCLESFSGEEGVWDDVDTSNCTTSTNLPFVVYSTYLLNDINNDINQNISQIIAEFQGQFDNATVSLMLHEGEIFRGVYQIIPAVFTITSDSYPLSFDMVTANIVNNYNTYETFEEFSEAEEPPEVVEMTPNVTCSCELFSGVNTESLRIPGVEASLSVAQGDVCIGRAGPCICDVTTCMCNAPFYTGDDALCGQDSDQDGRPDIGLDCANDTCQQDVCPFISNREQNPSDCDNTSNIQGGCPLESDPEFGILWPSSVANSNVTNTCSSGIGTATRFCDSDGNWQTPIVSQCSSFEYVALRQQATALAVLLNDPGTSVEAANSIAMELATVTDSADNTSILPLDLESAVFALDVVVDAAIANPELLQEEEFVDNLASTYDNLLSPNNEPGYTQADRNQSQMILQTSETFAITLANSTDGNVTIIRPNIVIAVEQRNISESNDSVIFPSQDLRSKMPDSFVSAANSFIIIPPSLIKERAINSITPIANVFYQNLESFLPSDLDDEGRRPMPISLLLSSQVTNTASNISGDPVVILFQYSTENVTDARDLRCAFWDFTLNGGDGGWSIAGVTTVRINDSFVNCTSTHLTSFAVLVDVSGTRISGAESTALSVVTYIGCGISLFCLIIAIFLLLVYRKTIFKGIHNFIHLNLAIALFLALVVFVSGIEPAADSRNGCKVVAALLHYFFTCVFTWMLCEGIMLYFLLVKVFNTGLGKNKLFYLATGWGIPVPIVAIAAGVAHEHYGTIDYCWISTDEGAIWAFVGPMLSIITVNVFFLFMALRALFKSKKRTLSVDQTANADIVKAILKATVILLPLLGLTWVFGLLAVNEDTTVFAWIFTVLNSLQGMFILIFHVIKNEKVLAKLKPILCCQKNDYKVTSTGPSSSTGYTGTRKKSSAVASSLQNDVSELHSVTEKPFFAKINNSDLVESTNFRNENTFKPYTTTEEEAIPKTTVAGIPDDTNTSIYIENSDAYTPGDSNDIDYGGKSAMDLGPVLAIMPDIVTFEVATGNSKEDVLVSCSHEHTATPEPYNEDPNTAASDSNIEPNNNSDN